MKLVPVLFIVLFGSVGLFAQAAKATKVVGAGPRYEIVEVRRTLPVVGGIDRAVIKLDTYSGQTYYAIPDVVQKYVWLNMSVEGGLPTESTEAPRYRIYVLPDITYLLNIETGKTWVLPAIIRTWKPFKDN
jgi:hypothetical protein